MRLNKGKNYKNKKAKQNKDLNAKKKKKKD